MDFPLFNQRGSTDCGLASLMMIMLFYGIKVPYDELCLACNLTSKGISLYSLNLCAKRMGFKTAALKCNANHLDRNIVLPTILYWKEKHFSVLFQSNEKEIYIADPIQGHICYSFHDFASKWHLNDKEYGILLELKPLTTYFTRK